MWPSGGGQMCRVPGLTITSETKKGTEGPFSSGIIDGQGKRWWNEYTIGASGPSRPKALYVAESANILLENIALINSPSFNVRLDDVLHAEVRYVTVNTDKAVRGEESFASATFIPKTGWLQPEDLNTDGIDPSGRDVWIHDCYVRNDDDSIAVKPCNRRCKMSDCSQDMLIEDSVMIGMGLSIGSVPPNKVQHTHAIFWKYVILRMVRRCLLGCAPRLCQLKAISQETRNFVLCCNTGPQLRP